MGLMFAIRGLLQNCIEPMFANNCPMQNYTKPMSTNNRPMQIARSQCLQTTILCKLHEANVHKQQPYAKLHKANVSNQKPHANRIDPMLANKSLFPTCGKQDFPCTGHLFCRTAVVIPDFLHTLAAGKRKTFYAMHHRKPIKPRIR